MKSYVREPDLWNPKNGTGNRNLHLLLHQFNSFVPVVVAKSGSLQVINTDAEGRLTLADALVFAEGLGVDAIIDSATLTGACLVRVSPVGSKDPNLLFVREGVCEGIERSGFVTPEVGLLMSSPSRISLYRCQLMVKIMYEKHAFDNFPYGVRKRSILESSDHLLWT